MIDLDRDPRLTAYVLDELGSDEREIFERDLEDTDLGCDAAELMAEIEEVARILEEAFANEPEVCMTVAQREAVLGPRLAAETEQRPAEVNGKVLPWVSRPTIGKKDKAVVAEKLRREQGSRARSRAVVSLAAAACLAAGMLWVFWEVGMTHHDFAPVATQELVLDSADVDVMGERREFVANQAPMDRSVSRSEVVASSVGPRNDFGRIEAPDDAQYFEHFMETDFGAGGFGSGSAGGGGSRRFMVPVDPAITGDWDAGGNEKYSKFSENEFKRVLEGDNQLSTFSIDVDTASYSNIRRMLRAGQRPPASAVRIEEMVNYFAYDYPQPEGEHPFSANLEVAASPWTKGNRLVRIGLKGRVVPPAERPDSNLVFLIDVSGSMQSSTKLPLLQAAMTELVENLREQDSVAIVVYAGNSGLVLEATSGALQAEILSAIGNLRAGGSTNGGAGIELAYKVAKEHYIKGGVNRVILATDGDFNVGVTNDQQLVKMVADRAADNIFLTVLGFGSGNLNDELIEEMSNRGNGNSFYIDSLSEGRKVLVEGVGGTLDTIAKDVKIQIEFNPAKVQSYRLIGYENRMLRNRDFNDDKIDAGEVGAGHTVTALYEIVPVGVPGEVDPLKYGEKKEVVEAEGSPELLTLKLRYKQPEGRKSVKFDLPLVDAGNGWEDSSDDFRFASAVAGFGMLLRGSEFKGELSHDLVEELAGEGIGQDAKGYRKEFLELLKLAQGLR